MHKPEEHFAVIVVSILRCIKVYPTIHISQKYKASKGYIMGPFEALMDLFQLFWTPCMSNSVGTVCAFLQSSKANSTNATFNIYCRSIERKTRRRKPPPKSNCLMLSNEVRFAIHHSALLRLGISALHKRYGFLEHLDYTQTLNE